MDKLANLTCRDFSEALAAKQSVPGGGGTAAFAGALGAALGSMAANFTLGKPAFAEVEGDLQRLLDQAEAIRCRLLDLVDEDAEAFAPLARAYSLDKDDPTRAEAIEQCTKDALAAPLQVMQQACLAIEFLEALKDKVNPMLLSDVGCAAALCSASLRSASMNVFVNTVALHDRDYAAEADAQCDEMLAEYMPRAGAIANDVENSIRSSR